MWFAALGSYKHNPWLISFIDRLLDDCKPVIELIDEKTFESEKDRILAIRATLFDYDFTRADTDWNRRIPGAEIVSNYNNSRRKWWSRKAKGEYLPVLEPDNDSVKSFLSNYGLASSCLYKDDDKCKDVFGLESTANKVCESCSFVRKWRLIWIPIVLTFISSGMSLLKNALQ